MENETQKAIWKIQEQIMKEQKRGVKKDVKKFNQLQAELNRMVKMLRDERNGITPTSPEEPKEIVEEPIKEKSEEPKEEKQDIKSTIKNKIGLKPSSKNEKKSKSTEE